MTDILQSHAAGLESPATRLIAVVPDDDATLPLVTGAIAVGAEDFVQVTTMMGDSPANSGRPSSGTSLSSTRDGSSQPWIEADEIALLRHRWSCPCSAALPMPVS